MGLAENAFGWMWVNGAEEMKGLNYVSPITQASPLWSEANNVLRVSSGRLGESCLSAP